MRARKTLAALIIALMILLNPMLASAAPQIIFTTNGAARQYAPGAVLLVQGWVGENQAGLSGIPALVVVQNGSNTIYTSQVNTDSSGFFTTNFNLGAGDKAGDTVKISVHAASTTQEDSVTIASQSKTFEFLGGSIPLSSANSTLTAQPVPSQIDLVFNSNVNFFNNNQWPSAGLPSGVTSFLGLNERNQDCISIYDNSSGNQINCSVVLGSSEATYGEYYPLDSSVKTNKDPVDSKVVTQKNVLRLVPSVALSQGTTYRIVIDQDLSANSSASLGESKTVYFKTEAAPVVVVPTTGGGGGTPAQNISTVKSSEGKEEITVDPTKVLAAMQKGEPLVIDLSTLEGAGNKEVVVNLPQEVIAEAQRQNQDIVLNGPGYSIVIPAGALPANQPFSLSIQQVAGSGLPTTPTNLNQMTVYEYNVGEGGSHNFNQALTLSFPVPQGTANPELLCVYFLNETTGQWEYVGGRIVNGRLTAETNHLSKYMVAESTKTFADIADHWAKNTIEVMVARQVISGVSDGEFAPDRQITRAEFACLLTRALHQEKDLSDSGFSDVNMNDWYAGYVSRAAKLGLVCGYDGKFNPDATITRQEMACMIMSAYKYSGGKLDALTDLTFVDKDNVSAWAVDSVKGAYKLGIIQGRGQGLFAPLENASRAEAAVMLKSLMDKVQ
ncbi:MAG: S-layer homology domain-containing protein [Syntrophomonadaceae bacterium]